MKYKQKVDFIVNLFLLLIGIVLLFLGALGFGKIKYVFIIVLFLYAILNFIQFFLTKENRDYEGLYTAIASLSIAFMTLFFYYDNNITLALILLGWTTLMAIIKFIKTDYYNDRHDRMWKVRMFTLVIFILMGVLSSFVILTATNKVIVLGYYFFINGVLELIDPITKYLIGR